VKANDPWVAPNMTNTVSTARAIDAPCTSPRPFGLDGYRQVERRHIPLSRLATIALRIVLFSFEHDPENTGVCCRTRSGSIENE